MRSVYHFRKLTVDASQRANRVRSLLPEQIS